MESPLASSKPSFTPLLNASLSTFSSGSSTVHSTMRCHKVKKIKKMSEPSKATPKANHTISYLIRSINLTFRLSIALLCLVEDDYEGKERAQVVYQRKKELRRLRVKAEKAAEEMLGSQLDILASVKY